MKHVIKHVFLVFSLVCVMSFCSSISFLAAEPETDSEVTHGKIVFYTEDSIVSPNSKKNNKSSLTYHSQSPKNQTNKEGLLPKTADKKSYVLAFSGFILLLLSFLMYKSKWSVRVT